MPGYTMSSDFSTFFGGNYLSKIIESERPPLRFCWYSYFVKEPDLFPFRLGHIDWDPISMYHYCILCDNIKWGPVYLKSLPFGFTSSFKDVTNTKLKAGTQFMYTMEILFDFSTLTFMKYCQLMRTFFTVLRTTLKLYSNLILFQKMPPTWR